MQTIFLSKHFTVVAFASPLTTKVSHVFPPSRVLKIVEDLVAKYPTLSFANPIDVNSKKLRKKGYAHLFPAPDNNAALPPLETAIIFLSVMAQIATYPFPVW